MEDVEGMRFSNCRGAMFSLVENTGRTKMVLLIIEGMLKYLNRAEYSLESEEGRPTDVEMTRNGGGEQEPHPASTEELGKTMKNCHTTAY